MLSKNIRIKYYIKTLSSIVKRRPFILYHKPTLSCNCKCEFCDFWKNSDPNEIVITKEKIKEILKDGWNMGFSTYVLWGGEPLMVKDLGFFLKTAKDIGYKTSMCTSGYLLKERYDDIKDNIDIIIISLESTGEKHNRTRRTPKLFEKIVEGIELFKNQKNVRLKIWSHINRINKDDALDVLKFAKKYGIIVEFFPSNIFSDYNENIILDKKERYDVFNRIIYYKKIGYPVNNSIKALKIMRDNLPYICNKAKISVQIENDGTINPCEPRFVEDMKSYGNIFSDGFTKLKDKNIYECNIKQLSKCDGCFFPCVGESVDNIFTSGFIRFLNFISNKDS